MKLTIKLLLAAAMLAVTFPTSAALKLRISDGTPGGTVVVTDQGVGDSSPSAGSIQYSGPIGLNWGITLNTGTTKPVLGSAAAPRFDLNTFDVSSAGGGTLTIELTDTDFTGTGPATFAIGGNSAGVVNFKAFNDNGNVEFGKSSAIVSVGPLSGNFSLNPPTTFSATAPYSLSFELVINHPAAGVTGLDAELNINPVPKTNCVQKAEPDPICSTSTNHHAMFMPGIAKDFVFIPLPGTFIEFPDGTAQISGTLVSVGQPGKSFILSLSLSDKTTVAPPGSPQAGHFKDCAFVQNGGPVDPSTFYYYTTFSGTLTGAGDLTGANLSIAQTMGLAFQVGIGANGKNYNFGGSSWFAWLVNQQPNSGPALPITGQGDFNLDIFDCLQQPAPPPVVNGSICGSVINDAAADASLTGDAGLSGVTVTLKNSGGTAVASTTTGLNGEYCFNNITAGTYSIVVTAPADFKQTVDPDGTKDNKTSVTFVLGQNVTGKNFGYAPPAAPTNLADAPGNAKVKLTWTASSGATSYTIKRSTTKGGPYAPIKTGVTLTSFTDSTVANGTVYYYIVCALKNAISSAPSAEVSSIPTAGVPSPWLTKDIGSVGDVGGASAASGKFTVIGSGNYIWGAADEFRFVYQPASGNCTLIARVTDVQDTDQWAKGGVMIRESLNANSRHASVFVTPTNGVAFEHRVSSGGISVNTFVAGLLAPQWVKVVRSGSTFSGYSSPDGMVWTLVSSQTITMSSSVYIGLAVNSHNDGVLCTVNFDNITATP